MLTENKLQSQGKSAFVLISGSLDGIEASLFLEIVRADNKARNFVLPKKDKQRAAPKEEGAHMAANIQIVKKKQEVAETKRPESGKMAKKLSQMIKNEQ